MSELRPCECVSWSTFWECVLVVMSIASSPLPYSSSSSSSSASCSSWSDLAGDEKRFSIGSMPCSSRTPESGTVKPVFLRAPRQHTQHVLSGRACTGADIPPHHAELVDMFALRHGATRHRRSGGRHVGGAGCRARVVGDATSSKSKAIRKMGQSKSRPGAGQGLAISKQSPGRRCCLLGARRRGRRDRAGWGCGSRRVCLAHGCITLSCPGFCPALCQRLPECTLVIGQPATRSLQAARVQRLPASPLTKSDRGFGWRCPLSPLSATSRHSTCINLPSSRQPNCQDTR